MRRHRTLATMMLGTAAILACILAPASAITAESSMNKQLVREVKKGDLDQVKTLLAQGADVNAEVDGRPVLMWAVDPGNLKRQEPMLKTAKKKAYWKSVNLDIVKYVVNQGADVNARDKGGRTALMCVVLTEELEIVRFLVDKGADVNARGDAIEYRMESSVASGLNLWSLFMATQNWPALMLAAESQNVEIMEFLIDKGADVNVRDKKGRTPLMWAVCNSDLRVVKLLVGKGADVHAKDEHGRSALTYAAERGYLEAVKLLIDNGADVNAEDKDGKKALSRASALNRTEIVQYLKAHGAK